MSCDNLFGDFGETSAFKLIHANIAVVLKFADLITTSNQIDKMSTFSFFVSDYVSILNLNDECFGQGNDQIVALFKECLERLSKFIKQAITETELPHT